MTRELVVPTNDEDVNNLKEDLKIEEEERLKAEKLKKDIEKAKKMDEERRKIQVLMLDLNHSQIQEIQLKKRLEYLEKELSRVQALMEQQKTEFAHERTLWKLNELVGEATKALEKENNSEPGSNSNIELSSNNNEYGNNNNEYG